MYIVVSTLWSFPLITVLLRYNSHAIKFTLLKSTVQWILVYSQSCACSLFI